MNTEYAISGQKGNNCLCPQSGIFLIQLRSFNGLVCLKYTAELLDMYHLPGPFSLFSHLCLDVLCCFVDLCNPGTHVHLFILWALVSGKKWCKDIQTSFYNNLITQNSINRKIANAYAELLRITRWNFETDIIWKPVVHVLFQ